MCLLVLAAAWQIVCLLCPVAIHYQLTIQSLPPHAFEGLKCFYFISGAIVTLTGTIVL